MNGSLFSSEKQPVEIIKWLIAIVGGFVHAIPELVWLLVGLMVFDFVFAVYAAWINEKVDPDRLWKGVHKNVQALLAIALMGFVDIYVDLMGLDLVQATTIAYIGPTLLRITQSMALAGVPLPPQLTQVLVLFQKPEEVKSADPNKPVS